MFTAMTAALDVGDIIDFNLDVAGIVTTGGSVARQVIVTSGANTTILFDVDGNNINSTGDVLITLTGQNLAATHNYRGWQPGSDLIRRRPHKQ